MIKRNLEHDIRQAELRMLDGCLTKIFEAVVYVGIIGALAYGGCQKNYSSSNRNTPSVSAHAQSSVNYQR